MTVYVDMDDVLCDFSSGCRTYFSNLRDGKKSQSRVGFFLGLKPIVGAIKSVNKLRAHSNLEVYILTAPSVRNPASCS